MAVLGFLVPSWWWTVPRFRGLVVIRSIFRIGCLVIPIRLCYKWTYVRQRYS